MKKRARDGCAATLVLLSAAGCGGQLDHATTGEPASATGTRAPNSDAAAPGADYPADAASAVGSEPDGAADTMFDPVSPGLAGFAFVVDDVVQHPMTCPNAHWEFSSSTTPTCGGAWTTDRPRPSGPPCDSGLDHAYLVNTGKFPVEYYAAGGWERSVEYYPTGPIAMVSGDVGAIGGVLDPGARVDITSVYAGGIVALLGSSAPFSSPDPGTYTSDEGSIPWPAGTLGSEGSSTMWLAEIEVTPSCTVADEVW